MINKAISLITLSIVIIPSILSGNTISTNAATNDGGGNCTYADGKTTGRIYGGGKTCCAGPSTIPCEAITGYSSYTKKNKTNNNSKTNKNNIRKTNNSRMLSKKTNKKANLISKISTNNKSKVHNNNSYIS